MFHMLNYTDTIAGKYMYIYVQICIYIYIKSTYKERERKSKHTGITNDWIMSISMYEQLY